MPAICNLVKPAINAYSLNVEGAITSLETEKYSDIKGISANVANSLDDLRLDVLKLNGASCLQQASGGN